jgi:mono/diheme cytochrome c family protein
MRVMRLGVLTGFAVTAGLLAWGALADPPAAPEELEVDHTLAELGRPYYRAFCASCHGVDGLGDGPVASALRTRPADLTKIAARRGGHFPDGQIAQFIDGRFTVAAHGSREMPIWGQVFTRDIPESDVAESIARGKVLVLVEYLKSLQTPARAARP